MTHDAFRHLKSANIFELGGRTYLFAHLFIYFQIIYIYYIRLAPRAGKMNQTLRCDTPPERAGRSYLAHSGIPAVSRKKNILRVYRPRLRLGPQTRKKTWAISSHLDQTNLVNNPYQEISCPYILTTSKVNHTVLISVSF